MIRMRVCVCVHVDCDWRRRNSSPSPYVPASRTSAVSSTLHVLQGINSTLDLMQEVRVESRQAQTGGTAAIDSDSPPICRRFVLSM